MSMARKRHGMASLVELSLLRREVPMNIRWPRHGLSWSKSSLNRSIVYNVCIQIAPYRRISGTQGYGHGLLLRDTKRDPRNKVVQVQLSYIVGIALVSSNCLLSRLTPDAADPPICFYC